jgi:F0F1-type ATP synthase assembly protein I
MSLSDTARFLKLASLVFIFFGGLSALAVIPILSGPQKFLGELIYLDFDGSITIQTQAELLLTSILGGILVGFGVLLWQLVDKFYQSSPKEVARVIVIGLSAWYVVDTTASIISGAPFNLVLNAGLLGMFLVPLYLSKQSK